MTLDKILAISGKPGLYELKTQTRGGFVAESLIDGKRMSVNMRHNVSVLSEIAIYTMTEEVPLREVLSRIKEKQEGAPALSHKEPKDKLTTFFSEVLPDYDEERVYPSDIKKVVQWYNLLQSKDIMDFSAPVESATDEEE